MWVSEAMVSSDLTCSLKPRKSERPAAPQDFPQELWAWGACSQPWVTLSLLSQLPLVPPLLHSLFQPPASPT